MDSLMQQQESFATLSVWGKYQLGTYVSENVVVSVEINEENLTVQTGV